MEISEIIKYSLDNERYAQMYLDSRKEATTNLVDFKIFQARNLDKIKGGDRAGIEMLELLTIRYEPKMEEVYRKWKENEALYKGFERLIETKRDTTNSMKLEIKAENYK